VLSEHGVPIASRSYRAFKARPASARACRDEHVLAEIRRVFKASGQRYGVRKVYWQLRREGLLVDGAPVARCTVERLMKAAGLQGVSRRKTFRTTRPDPTATRPADLVQRQFTADRPNKLWVVDFTYVATFSGFVYVAFAVDVFSRMIVGWRAARTMRTELPLDALDMALWHRSRLGQLVVGLVHHSDAGSQDVSMGYTARLLDAGARASVGSVGDSYDNALAESLIGAYKAELVRHQGPWRGLDDLELATLTWVDWYNHARLHEALSYRPPAEVEAEHYRHITLPEQPLAGEPARP
jgi:putative transposase